MVAGWRGSAIGAGWQGEKGATRDGAPVVRRNLARRVIMAPYERGRDENRSDSFTAEQGQDSRRHLNSCNHTEPVVKWPPQTQQAGRG